MTEPLEGAARIRGGIDKALKTLRQCDTQATAVAWMAEAYKLMEACLPYLEPPREAPIVFTFKPPKIVVARSFPKIVHDPTFRFVREQSETVVYPEAFLHPGLKPPPRAWTRADTLRLENAAKAREPWIQKKGQ